MRQYLIEFIFGFFLKNFKKNCGVDFFVLKGGNFFAESEGFEPPVRLPLHRISSAAHSTTLTTLQKDFFYDTKLEK